MMNRTTYRTRHSILKSCCQYPRLPIQISLFHFVQDFFYFCPFLRSGQISLLFAFCFLFQILIPFLLIFYFLYLLQTYDQAVLFDFQIPTGNNFLFQISQILFYLFRKLFFLPGLYFQFTDFCLKKLQISTVLINSCIKSIYFLFPEICFCFFFFCTVCCLIFFLFFFKHSVHFFLTILQLCTVRSQFLYLQGSLLCFSEQIFQICITLQILFFFLYGKHQALDLLRLLCPIFCIFLCLFQLRKQYLFLLQKLFLPCLCICFFMSLSQKLIYFFQFFIVLFDLLIQIFQRLFIYLQKLLQDFQTFFQISLKAILLHQYPLLSQLVFCRISDLFRILANTSQQLFIRLVQTTGLEF